MKKIKVISLFSGCGGLDLGFKKEGFEIVYANDNEKSVKETYEKNLGHSLDSIDIRSVEKSKIPYGDIILAGIPCQPFSSAGKRESTMSEKGNLFKEVLEVIKVRKKKPKVVVFENVRGFLSSKDEKGFLMTHRFQVEMKKVGYNTYFELLNASDYGVPSNRYRVFIICIRKDLNLNYSFPIKNNSKKITVGDVLSKPLPKNENQEIWKLSPSAIDIAKYIPEGGSWKDVPYEKLPERLKKIRDNIKKYRSPNFYRRFSKDEIMGTVTASSTPENSGILHPIELRRYSVREIARFQSFPDTFKFYGDSVQKKYKMIGNSVPPKLASAVARSLKEQIFS